MPESRVTRSMSRETLSRCYNVLVRTVLGVRIHDAQCGFKAATKQSIDELVPRVKSNGWFFDTELLVLAVKNGFRIRELPVTWIEDPRSKVRVAATVYEQLIGLLRLRFSTIRFRQ